MKDEFIILSIKPTYVNKIIQNEKTVELRRIKPKKLRKNSLVIIYASSPIQSLIGAFSVKTIVEAPLNELWNNVEQNAGISRKEFEDYFFDKDIGVGIFIDSFYKFENPINLKEIQDIWNNFIPPQGFRYASLCDLNVPQIVSLFKT